MLWFLLGASFGDLIDPAGFLDVRNSLKSDLCAELEIFDWMSTYMLFTGFEFVVLCSVFTLESSFATSISVKLISGHCSGSSIMTMSGDWFSSYWSFLNDTA